MTHFIILGAGIAGVTAAYSLMSKIGPNDEVTVVSDKPYFHFVPSNPWIAMGWRERADIAFPIWPFFESRGIKFIHSAVKRIQPDVLQVDLNNGDVLFYDYLLIATGVVGRSDEIPGMVQYTQSVIHIDQAEQAFKAYREFVRHPGSIVIGAAAGASVLGPLYEYAFLIDADLKRRNIRDQIPITLVTPEPWPGHLGLGDEGSSRSAVTAALAAANINVICNARTLSIDQDTIHLVEYDAAGHEKQTRTLPYAFSMYWPAFGGAPGVNNARGLVDERGLVVVDEYLRNPDYPNVFAIGTCVAQPMGGHTPVPVGPPDSVYSIQKAGEIAVQNIVALASDAPLVSYAPQHAHWLNDMSDSGASYLSEPQVPLRDINWMRQGRWVHQAKLDFEQSFINKIRLQPASLAPSALSRIAGVMSLSLSENNSAQTASRPGSGKPLEIRLSQDASIELRALAVSLARDPNVLAAELLTAAVSDVKTYLNASGVEAMARARRELLVAELPEHQPGGEFHGGGT